MNQTPHRLRIAAAALFAAVVLPATPVASQEAAPPPQAAAPPPVVTISPPPPTITAPPPAAAAPAVPTPRIDIVPQTRPTVATPAAPRTARAAPVRTRAAAPVRRAAPAPAPVARAPAAAPAPAPEAVAPVAALPPPVVAEPVAVPVETQSETGVGSMLPWLLAGGALILAAIAFFAFRRRRTADEIYEEAPAATYVEPAVVAEPGFVRPTPETAFVAPVAAAAAAAEPATAEEVSLDDADQADVDALAADSTPVAGRPWLEFLLRPVRAGTSQDDTVVQFELTVGNTGTVPAKDVRISTWMFAAGPGTEMERMLIDPPADATVSEVDIAAGDGTRVDGEISLPKAANADTIIPVVVADARYRLPDGTEGRTSASFAIGLPEGDGIAPFQLDRATGLIESVEARLHGTPQRT